MRWESTKCSRQETECFTVGADCMAVHGWGRLSGEAFPFPRQSTWARKVYNQDQNQFQDRDKYFASDSSPFAMAATMLVARVLK